MIDKDKATQFMDGQVDLALKLGLTPWEVQHLSLHSVATLAYELSREPKALPWSEHKKWVLSQLGIIMERTAETVEALNPRPRPDPPPEASKPAPDAQAGSNPTGTAQRPAEPRRRS